MSDPPHPGESIREDCIKAVGPTVTAAAAELGIPGSPCPRSSTATTASPPTWPSD